jgi:hypothetical protein
VNLFAVVNIVAEFVGSGIQPYVRIDILTLTRLNDFGGNVTTVAEVTDTQQFARTYENENFAST